jgi:hypothetical protein
MLYVRRCGAHFFRPPQRLAAPRDDALVTSFGFEGLFDLAG